MMREYPSAGLLSSHHVASVHALVAVGDVEEQVLLVMILKCEPISHGEREEN